MKNIITPIDFSDHSIYALKVAAKIAKKYNYSITIIHMLEMPHGFSHVNKNYNLSINYLLKYAEERFNEIVKETYLKDITVNFIVKHFTVFSDLAEIAKQQNSSLIVMGSHGKDGNENSYLGYNTEKVIKNSKIPVLVVKEELENITFDNAVFISDFKIECADAYLRMKKFYDEIGIQPKMLFINIPGSGFVSSRELEQRFKLFLMEVYGNLNHLNTLINYDDHTVLNGVKAYIYDNDVSLISVATHGISGFPSLFHHSISIEIINKTKQPALTILI